MKIGEAYGNSNNKLIKSISSSGKTMFIELKKQVELGAIELEASIKYNKIMSVCQTWLDVKENTLISYNHPINTNCSWVITANFESYIILNFEFIEVYFLILSNIWSTLETKANFITFAFC